MAVRSLDTVSMHRVALVGGKAGSLGQLLQAGFNVPRGFVITADTQQMSAQLEQEVLALFDSLKLERVAVRSSGVSEDGTNQSWAGQFATFLHVGRSGLIKAIQACWDSANAARVQAYGQAGKLAVLVQQMVDSETSGVAFSVNPVTKNQNEVMIEAVYGLCEPLVQGTTTPDNYILNKSGTVIQQDIANKTTQLSYQNGALAEMPVATQKQQQPALSPAQLTELAALVADVEHHYSFAVDIEWAYQNNRLYLVQARPITTV